MAFCLDYSKELYLSLTIKDTLCHADCSFWPFGWGSVGKEHLTFALLSLDWLQACCHELGKQAAQTFKSNKNAFILLKPEVLAVHLEPRF